MDFNQIRGKSPPKPGVFLPANVKRLSEKQAFYVSVAIYHCLS
jgi:hypothetical protein